MWLVDLQEHLAATGHGTKGQTLFVGRLPDEPSIVADDAVLGLMIEPGNAYFTMGKDGSAIRAPMFALSSRHASYQTAYDAIEGAWKELGKVGDETLGTTHFMALLPQGDIEDMDRDDLGRQEFTARFMVWMEG